MTILPDGTYDVIVVEVGDDHDGPPGHHPTGDGPTGTGLAHLSLTILSGEHRSEVVDVAVAHLGRPAYDLLGLPGTLTVTDGTPHLVIDD